MAANLRGVGQVNSGRKKKPLADKITQGKTKYAKHGATVIADNAELEETIVELDGAELTGENTPPPEEYLRTKQKDGRNFHAEKIYNETYAWLKRRGCDKLITKQLVESYAQSFARYIQAEEALSNYGLLGKHPTTGVAITSPYVSISQSFQKQAYVLWYQIFQIVKENCSTQFSDNPNDKLEKELLSF